MAFFAHDQMVNGDLYECDDTKGKYRISCQYRNSEAINEQLMWSQLNRQIGYNIIFYQSYSETTAAKEKASPWITVGSGLPDG